MNLAEPIDAEFPWEKNHGIFELKENTLCFTCFYLDPYVKDIASTINKIYDELVEYEFKPWIDHYIWSCTLPRIEVRHDHGRSYIIGCLEFGENILDETLVTSLLYNFSSRYQDLYIHIFDNEGEFLLIEMADYIPEFLGTNNGMNRPWINSAQLLIIPNDYYNDENLSLTKSLTFLETCNFKLLKSPSLDDQLAKLLNPFPEKVLKNILTIKVKTSKEVAGILCNNHKALASISIQESFSNPQKESESCSNSVQSVELKIKVTALCYLNLITADILNNDAKIGSHLLKGLNMLSDLGYDIKPAVLLDKRVIEEYERDHLQMELIKRLKIKNYVDGNFEFNKAVRNDTVEQDEEENLIGKLKEVFQNSSTFKGMDKSENDYNDDSDYSSDTDDDKVRKYLAEQKIDIDEDDFFEFFCKEALKLKDEDIELFKNSVDKPDDGKDGNNTSDDGMAEEEDDDNDDIEFDEETIQNLLQALKMGQGSGPLNTLLGDFQSANY